MWILPAPQRINARLDLEEDSAGTAEATAGHEQCRNKPRGCQKSWYEIRAQPSGGSPYSSHRLLQRGRRDMSRTR